VDALEGVHGGVRQLVVRQMLVVFVEKVRDVNHVVLPTSVAGFIL
jgi:hypothetical protein